MGERERERERKRERETDRQTDREGEWKIVCDNLEVSWRLEL